MGRGDGSSEEDLLRQHKALSLDCQHPRRKLGAESVLYHHSATERWRQEDPEDLAATCPWNQRTPGSMRHPVSKNKALP
ncbi:mCG141439 [Mus musculus]|nr:mCG141439 [Mus musculus]